MNLNAFDVLCWNWCTSWDYTWWDCL